MVHSKDKDKQMQRDRTQRVRQVTAQYEAYAHDPFLVPRNMSYLSDKWSLENCIKMITGILWGWLQSVPDIFQQHQRSKMHFFPLTADHVIGPYDDFTFTAGGIFSVGA